MNTLSWRIVAILCMTGWGLSVLFESVAAEGLVEVGKLLASDPDAEDFLGGHILVQEDWLFADRRFDDENGTNSGAVVVFRRNGSDWTEVQQLRPSIAGANDFFGGPMAVDGDTLMVGSRARDDTVGGTVFVFEYDGTQWVETQLLTPSIQQADAFFGQGGFFDLEGDTAIIGAYRETIGGVVNAGSVYVFEFDGSQWIETQRIASNTPSAHDTFGVVVRMDGDTAMIHSRKGVGTNAGLIHVYRHDGSAWVAAQILEPGDPAANEFFGNTFEFEDDTLVASAIGDSNNKGAVYVFKEDNGQWSEELKYVPAEIVDNDQFGGQIAIDGDRILIGARNRAVDSMSNVGTVYCYRFSGSSLLDEESFTVSDPEESLFFPSSIALQGDIAFIGAQRDDEGGIEDQGSVYIFRSFACEQGTVNAGNDTLLNALFVEASAGGDDRTIEIGDGDFVDVTVVQPAGGGNGKFVIHANLGDLPTGVPYVLPFDIGSTCFPLLLNDGASPIIVANSLARSGLLGESAFFGNPQSNPERATTTFTYPPLPYGMILTFQGVIVDPSSAGSKAVSVTNSVVVRVE